MSNITVLFILAVISLEIITALSLTEPTVDDGSGDGEDPTLEYLTPGEVHTDTVLALRRGPGKRPRPTSAPRTTKRTTPRPRSCTASIRTDLAKTEPVFIKNGKLELPSRGNLDWRQKESVDILCSGQGNKVDSATSKESTIKCDFGHQFTVGKAQKKISAISCRYKVTGDVDSTSASCGRSGKLTHIGFRGSKRFVKLYDSCFDAGRASVLYTHHQLFGKEIRYKAVSPRPDFKSEGFSKNANPRTAYTQAEQLVRFTKLLGNSKAIEYINDSTNLQRGHLTPDADQLFKTWQWATYFFINVAPMWNTINNGNWRQVEETVRDFASRNNLALDVFTGTSDVLALNSVPITLDANGIPVPRWLWKIIKNGNEAIAFVVSNNPFELDAPNCGKNVADGYGWKHANFNVKGRGIVACCSVGDAANVIGSIPSGASALSVLRHK
ncbi:uncharacterized protein LOC131681646 [Topomyia yanbarensis]|uniref:uncharacterized protein LOC131681646 n=1 Tax=Topomyia yanbarensis TaxID=2498891 RepID=UPI00273B482E|nr:uncharacterized protein LOC131681646 [Topomyia yanbarensis]